MISKKEVEHIASLARIGLTEDEKVKFANDLANILDYVNKLNELDLKNVEPTSYVVESLSITREDDAVVNLSNESKAKLLKTAPNFKNGYIGVKEVFEE